MVKKLLIIIPTYNQPELARRSLQSLAKQSWRDFSILLKDDGSREDYRAVISAFPDLDITYEKNPQNLGAVPNMISGLLSNRPTEFIMNLHEDDFLGPDYLKRAITILEENLDIALVACPSVFFDSGKSPAIVESPPVGWQEYGAADFTGLILNKNNFSFGSVIYRRALLRAELIDLKTYSVLFDRPFLINILLQNDKRAAILNGSFYYYQNHPYPDKRWQELTIDNVFNLYNFYQRVAPGKGRVLTGQYLFTFASLENKKWSNLPEFIRRGRRAGFVSWRSAGNRFLAASLFIALFGRKNYYRLFKLIKS